MKLSLVAGTTSKSIDIFIQDSSSTTGAGLTGLVFNSGSLTAYYHRPGGSATVITLATLAAITSAWSSGGFKEVDATNMPGMYRLDIPDAVLAASAAWATVMLKGATNMAPVVLEIELTAWNNQDGVRGGMTALPNAAAAASGGLPILGTNAAGIIINAAAGTDALQLNGGAASGASPAGQGLNATGGAASTSGGGVSGAGVKATGGAGAASTNGAAAGVLLSGGGTTTVTGGDGLKTSGTGNLNGINAFGAGTGDGLQGTGGATGRGFHGVGGATSGEGMRLEATTSGDGIAAIAVGTTKHGINASGGSVTSHGINATGGGVGHGILATSGGGATGDGIKAVAASTNGNGIEGIGVGSGHGLLATAGATGNGVNAAGGATSGSGVKITGTAGNAIGLEVAGQGSAAGAQITGGATGSGAKLIGGGTSGHGLAVTTTSGDGFNLAPTAGHGISTTGNGTSKHGIVTTGGTAGTSDGLNATAGTGGVDIRGNQTGSITSVTNRVTANSDQLAGDGTAATNLSKGADGLVASTCAAGATTTSIPTNLTQTVDALFVGRAFTLTGGTYSGAVAVITGYVGSTKTLTVSPALPGAPANTDPFVIS